MSELERFLGLLAWASFPPRMGRAQPREPTKPSRKRSAKTRKARRRVKQARRKNRA